MALDGFGKRGRSQVFFKYLPGSVFNHKGQWFQVAELRMREVSSGTRGDLVKEVYDFVDYWSANKELPHDPYPRRDEAYFLGEITDLNVALFPLVFHCANFSCQNTHTYRDINHLYKQNPKLQCEFCHTGKLVQYPYALSHVNGDIQPILVTSNKGSKTWKERYDGIRMHDTRRFTTARWYNYKKRIVLGSLRTRSTTMQIPPGTSNLMSGTHLGEGDIHYPALKSFVNLKPEVIQKRQQNLLFPYVQLGALLGMESVDLSDYDANFDKNNERDALNKLLQAANEHQRQMLLQLMQQNNISAATSRSNLTVEVDQLFPGGIPKETVLQDRSLHEYLFTRCENEGFTLQQKMLECQEQEDIVQETTYKYAQTEVENLGLDSVMILEKFPVLTMGMGFSRKTFDRKRGVLNPFKQRVGTRDRIVIPILRNENEAILFKMDPLRVLAWLVINNFLTAPTTHVQTQAEAHAYLYQNVNYTQVPINELARLQASDYTKDKGTLASIMGFRLLHSLMHLLLQSGKTVLGLDVDSMSEYLFPSAMAGAIYVSKLQGGGMGALISAFDSDLERWLRNTYDQAHTCLYDPVCREHHGACHACLYLKFSCTYFNHALSRNLLTGGAIADFGDYPIIGYFSFEVDELINRWRG